MHRRDVQLNPEDRVGAAVRDAEIEIEVAGLRGRTGEDAVAAQRYARRHRTRRGEGHAAAGAKRSQGVR